MASDLRRRKKVSDIRNEAATSDYVVKKETEKKLTEETMEGSYWLNRIVFLRSLAFIYCKNLLCIYIYIIIIIISNINILISVENLYWSLLTGSDFHWLKVLDYGLCTVRY